jgi:hypothetical protein
MQRKPSRGYYSSRTQSLILNSDWNGCELKGELAHTIDNDVNWTALGLSPVDWLNVTEGNNNEANGNDG